MRLFIVADGSPTGAEVYNADTGEKLDGVLAVYWRHERPGTLPRALILVQPAGIAAEATVVLKTPAGEGA